MWVKLARFVLKFRIPLISFIALVTLFMAYNATKVQMTYDFPKIIPPDHPSFIEYDNFKKQFGEDGSILVMGIQTDRLFEHDVFSAWHQLGEDLKQVDGVDGILSIPHAITIEKDTSEKKFIARPLVSQELASQTDVDAVRDEFFSLPIYDGVIYNSDTKATIMAVTINPKKLDSKERLVVVNQVHELGESFAQNTNVDVKYSGLPFIRSFQMNQISKELRNFLLLATLLIGIILFLLFRSFSTVFYPLLVVAIGVIWSLGTLGLLGYRITILTGLIPTLIVVIGIPNCIYLINRYHEEYRRHGSRKVALEIMVTKIGHVTFFANLTTAIGFGVFATMDSIILQEFGLVAGLNIACTYIISIIVIPVVFSFIPSPKESHLKHLDRTFFKGALDKLTQWTWNHGGKIVFSMLLIIGICLVGLMQLESKGFLFDDVPKEAQEYKDLKFFEGNFRGVMPFDILIDSKKKNGITKASFLKKIEKVQRVFDEDTLFSKPLSIVDGIKFANQAFFKGKKEFYTLPNGFDRNFIFTYLKNSGNTNGGLLKSLTDSTQSVARISLQMADVGSQRFPILMDSLRPKVEAIIDTSKYDITYTGTSLVALEGYAYLVNGLIWSVLLAFCLIALIIAYLFRNLKMLLVALLPNVIPLIVTAAIMGYFHIPLKPSTVLVFSVAFGISVDFTIHFLAKYRQELENSNGQIAPAVQSSIRETGFSMIYTALILFTGFIVFAFSSFEGTYYLGLLTSVTLIVSLFTNLLLLPSVIYMVEGWSGNISKK